MELGTLVSLEVKGTRYEGVVVKNWENKEVEIQVPVLKEKIWRSVKKITVISSYSAPVVSEAPEPGDVSTQTSEPDVKYYVGAKLTWRQIKQPITISDVSRLTEKVYGGNPCSGIVGYEGCGGKTIWLPIDWLE